MAPKKVVPKAKVVRPADDDRKDSRNMLTQASNASATSDQKAMLELYKSYPRFDDKKKEILNKWRGDKSCSWITSYVEVNTKTNEVDTRGLHGHGTMCISQLINAACIMYVLHVLYMYHTIQLLPRYDVAALANLKLEIPVQKKLCDAICAGLEQDDDWDESDLFEKAYKASGLKRYKLDKKLLTASSLKETYSEAVSSSSSKDGKAAPRALQGLQEPEIKIQNPEFVELTNLTKTCKSASAAVATLLQHFKKILPSLLVMDDKSSEGLSVFTLVFLLCHYVISV